MDSSPTWSSAWSRRWAARQPNLCDLLQVRSEARDTLLELLRRTLNGQQFPDLRAEFILSHRQSATILEGTSEAVILFDLTQSMVLKRLFRLVSTDQPYDEAARVLAAAAGLAVANDSPGLCSELLDITVPERGEYLHEEKVLFEHYRVLRRVLQNLLTEWESSLIDGFIFAHEVSHFAFSREDPLMTRLRFGARSAFEYALDQVCYERRPDFEEIAQHGGDLPKEEESLALLRRDLVNRRAHYEATREHLIEEITCDGYALTMLADSHIRAWRPETRNVNAILEGFSRFAQTFFMIATLSDLHQAMMNRAKLSAAAGIDSEKPGNIADMHFRKMALMYLIAELTMTCIPRSEWSSKLFGEMLAQVTQALGAQKRAVDAVVVIPITRVIRARIVEIERGFAIAPPQVTQKPWLGRLDVLLGDHLPAISLHDDGARELIGIRQNSSSVPA